jgi:hypothetical protein
MRPETVQEIEGDLPVRSPFQRVGEPSAPQDFFDHVRVTDVVLDAQDRDLVLWRVHV